MVSCSIPCDEMSGKGGVEGGGGGEGGVSASSVRHRWRDFRAEIYHGYCQRKSFQACFLSLNTVLDINLSPNSPFSRISDSSRLERERWKTMTVVVEWQWPLPRTKTTTKKTNKQTNKQKKTKHKQTNKQDTRLTALK